MFKSIKGLSVALLLAAALPLTAYAQTKGKATTAPEEQSAAFGSPKQGDMAAGGNLALGMLDDLTNFGIGAKFQYNVTDPLRLEGSFTYFFERDLVSTGYGGSVGVSMWDLSVNAHWLFPVADKIAAYPLAGLSILGPTVTTTMPSYYGYGGDSFSVSATNFGINLGGGGDYQLTDRLILNAELKLKIATDWNRLLISAGAAYKF